MLFPSFMLMAASTACSDRCPLLVANVAAPPHRAHFCFEAFLPCFSRFRETVEWARPVNHGCAFTRLKIKMACMMIDLKIWSKTLFSDAKLQFHIATEIIRHLDVAQESRQLSPTEFSLRKLLKH